MQFKAVHNFASLLQITATDSRHNASYKGGLVVNKLENFDDMLIYKDEWKEEDRETLLKKWKT